MNLELVRTRTEDNVRLDGALRRSNRSPGDLPADLVIIVHGTGGNFYAPGILEHLATRLPELGTPTLRVNTRGHDGLSGGDGGAALEQIDDCRLDLQAWMTWATEHLGPRVLLLGHSMGGVKAIYATAHQAVQPFGIVAVSPPRFSHRQFQEHPDAEAFREDFQAASGWVSQGHGDQLIRVRQPLPMWIRAEGFVEKYGPEDRYDIARLLPRVDVPVLVLVGSETVSRSPAFHDLPDHLATLDLPPSRLEVIEVPGGDMHYTHDPDSPLRYISTWGQSLNSE
tara:strand:+ start:402 stop:1247 length:846 start_codon:yes stop_codon:yes gene_type:complete